MIMNVSFAFMKINFRYFYVLNKYAFRVKKI